MAETTGAHPPVGRRPGAGRGDAPAYAELHCHSNFSFLDGASHPEQLAEEAARRLPPKYQNAFHFSLRSLAELRAAL